MLHSLEGQHSNLAVEHVNHVSLLVRYLESEALAYRAVPRRSKLLVHRVLDQLRSRLSMEQIYPEDTFRSTAYMFAQVFLAGFA